MNFYEDMGIFYTLVQDSDDSIWKGYITFKEETTTEKWNIQKGKREKVTENYKILIIIIT